MILAERHDTTIAWHVLLKVFKLNIDQAFVFFLQSKIELYSRFERQPDKRAYGEKHTVFTGPTYLFPAEKINPTRIIKWDENSGLPTYEDMPGVERPAAEEEEE